VEGSVGSASSWQCLWPWLYIAFTGGGGGEELNEHRTIREMLVSDLA